MKTTPAPAQSKKPRLEGGPGDKVRVSLAFTIGIPGTYSSAKLETQYESSMLEVDEGSIRKLHRRCRHNVEELHGPHIQRLLSDLGLDQYGTPKTKGRVAWDRSSA